MADDKQLVIFLDFWGFKKYYDFVSRQKKPESQEYLFKAFFGLYHGYITRIREALNTLPQTFKGKFNGTKLDFIKKTQILTVSDSIVIAIDCKDENVESAFIFACFLLLRAIDESVKTDSQIEDFEKFGYLFYLPIRGGISYGYSITNLGSSPPFVFSSAYNDAVALEKRAAWPRILIEEKLAQKLKLNPLAESALNENELDIFFDPLKFKYHCYFNNPKILFENKEARIEFLENSLLPYKRHLEMCTKEGGLLYKHYINEYNCDEGCPVDAKKYKSWISYYNESVNLLISNDPNFSGRKDLLISEELWPTSFGYPINSDDGFHTICILPWITIEKIHEVNGIQMLPFPETELNSDFQSTMREVLKSYKGIRGRTLRKCSILASVSCSPGWSLKEEDHSRIEQSVSLFFLASMASNEYFVQHSTYSNSSAFQPIFQNVTLPPSGLAIEHRRRDGRNLDGGYQHGDLKFSCPLECKSSKPKIDEEFLLALDEAAKANDNLFRRLLVSLSFFRLANTDQSHMSLDAEVVQLGASYEILLDAEGAYQLACKYGEIFGRYKETNVDDALSGRPGIKLGPGYENEQKQWQLGRKFIEELHQLRSAIVHGEDRDKRKWGWSNFEHLVIGAYVYPLAVKLLLQTGGHYKLTDNDEIACRSIDIILAKTKWHERPSQTANHTNWQECISEANHRFLSGIIAQSLEESGAFSAQEE